MVLLIKIFLYFSDSFWNNAVVLLGYTNFAIRICTCSVLAHVFHSVLFISQPEDADVFSVLAFAGYLHVPVSSSSSPFLKRRLKRGTFLVTNLMLKLLCCSFLTVGTWKVTKVMGNGHGCFDYFVYFRLNNFGAELIGYRSFRYKVVSIQVVSIEVYSFEM